MSSKLQKLTLLVLFVFIAVLIQAQTFSPGTYEELSSASMKKQKDSLKLALKCPELFTKKETQKQYKEIWEARTSFILKAIESNQFIQSKSLYDYTYQILQQIIDGNKSLIPKAPLLLLDRSSGVNAYAMGNNLIAINIGFLSFAESREEVALALAHELSHNLLMHPENSMKERATLLTSEEYINNVNSILESKYGRYTKLKSIIDGYRFGSATHNRYHETEADSMAVLLLKNSKITFEPQFFLRLDSSDLVYKSSLKQSPKNYFSEYGIKTEDAWFKKTGRGLSMRNYTFTMENVSDSLKTHPDCINRYSLLLPQSTRALNAPLTPIPIGIKNMANKYIVWSLFVSNNLTAAMYRVFLEQDKAAKDSWHRIAASFILNRMYYEDKQMSRFNAINIKNKEYISSAYYELQNFFEQVPREQLELACKQELSQGFWQQSTPEDKSLKTIFSSINFSNDFKQKDLFEMKKDFDKNFTQSIFREFLERL
jgi:hypothetical protein